MLKLQTPSEVLSQKQAVMGMKTSANLSHELQEKFMSSQKPAFSKRETNYLT